RECNGRGGATLAVLFATVYKSRACRRRPLSTRARGAWPPRPTSHADRAGHRRAPRPRARRRRRRRGLDREVSWIHVSELPDPTPWLEGGELLATTGLGTGATAAARRAYVRRLSQHGLAGLAFGLGFGHV